MCLTLAAIISSGMAGAMPRKPSQAAFQADLPAPEINPAPMPPMTNSRPVSGRAISRRTSTNGMATNTSRIKREEDAQEDGRPFHARVGGHGIVHVEIAVFGFFGLVFLEYQRCFRLAVDFLRVLGR